MACSDILLVIPAFNEAHTIGPMMDRIDRHSELTALVVDDQSTDGTGDIAKKHGALVISHCTNLGAWGAMQTGIRYAVEHGFNAVITMDADGQHLPETLPILVKHREAADVVIGRCVERVSGARRLAWRYFRWLTKLPVEDLTSGFRFYGSRALRVLASREATLLDYQDVGLLIMLRNEGLSFVEVDVPMNTREHGQSKIFSSWWQVFSYIATTSIICFSKLLGGKK